MTTESPVRLIGNSGSRNWPLNKGSVVHSSSSSSLAAQELGLLLEHQRLHGNTMYNGPSRSGSAPPTMEGSATSELIGQQSSIIGECNKNLSNTIESCESEEQFSADPAYLAYYCSNVNLNPRLPPPLISRQGRRLVHHIGGPANNRNMCVSDDSSKGSLFMSRPALPTHKEEPEDERSPRVHSIDTTNRSSGFVSGQFTTMKGRHKSLVDLIQEDFPRTPSPVYASHVRAISHDVAEAAASSDASINPLQGSPTKMSDLSELSMAAVDVRGRSPIPGVHSDGSVPNSNLSAASARSSSDVTVSSHPILNGEISVNGGPLASDMAVPESGTVESKVKNMMISSDGYKIQLPRQHPQQVTSHPHGFSSQFLTGQPQMVPQGLHCSHHSVDRVSNDQPKLSSVEAQQIMQTTSIMPPLYSTASAYGTYYHNLQTSGLFAPQYSIGAYTLHTSPLPPLITGYPPQIAIPTPLDGPTSPNINPRMTGVPIVGNITPGVDYQNLYKLYGQPGVAIQPSFPDPFYIPYFQQPYADAYAPLGQYDSTVMRGNITGNLPDNLSSQKGPTTAAYLPSQRPHFPRNDGNSRNVRKGGSITPNYNGSNPHIGLLMQYATPPLSNPVFQGSPATGTSSPGRKNDRTRLSLSPSRNLSPYSGWQGQERHEKVDDPKYFLLEELKFSKSRKFELSNIAGRIIEFSSDQHGSRFIQQRLENCSVEEKASVFEEVLPHASTLMTDVFGNYVIQKFFEHGSPEQRKELANKLAGHILPLSLQMYGCRVIQKALEVIDLDQKTQLVLELDGHVMRCVRDQNGNHVIQKCIECVPTENIGFIILAFRGQVATLSTHPYGCRVIQRVLEHCTDEMQIRCIVDEILQSACILAQDQYGNYVTQHVLESGKSHERSQIINKLAGQIVQMSQHKFASNVIEKCVEHGNAEERELLIAEIVGQTEGNNNLLVMMKDQYANYVVQKILETCSNKQREILLNRIRYHLQALKKYTYGKHIVARVEEICGEETRAIET